MNKYLKNVTILILIDGFLQYFFDVTIRFSNDSHNPYFNRWFSAITQNIKLTGCLKASHNPYFNRWFSAI